MLYWWVMFAIESAVTLIHCAPHETRYQCQFQRHFLHLTLHNNVFTCSIITYCSQYHYLLLIYHYYMQVFAYRQAIEDTLGHRGSQACYQYTSKPPYIDHFTKHYSCWFYTGHKEKLLWQPGFRQIQGDVVYNNDIAYHTTFTNVTTLLLLVAYATSHYFQYTCCYF